MTVKLDTALAARWAQDPKSNHGLLLVHDGNCGYYHASEFEDAAMRPRLILAFDKALGSSAGVCPAPGKQVYE